MKYNYSGSNPDYRVLPTTFFDVKVAAIFTYSDLELELMGVPVNEDFNPMTGNTKFGNVESDIINVKLTPKRMLEIYELGGSLVLNNKSEAIRLYKIYKKYYDDWVNQSTHTLNVSNDKPKNELNMLERFMEEIYNYNGVAIVKDSITSAPNAFSINVNRLHSSGEYGKSTLDPIIVGGNTGLKESDYIKKGQYDMANQPSRPVINLDRHKPKRRINLHELNTIGDNQ